jgi:hypothetical protein
MYNIYHKFSRAFQTDMHLTELKYNKTIITIHIHKISHYCFLTVNHNKIQTTGKLPMCKDTN